MTLHLRSPTIALRQERLDVRVQCIVHQPWPCGRLRRPCRASGRRASFLNVHVHMTHATSLRCAARVGSRRHRFSISPLPEAVREDMAQRTHTKTLHLGCPGSPRDTTERRGGPQGSAKGSPDGSRDRCRVRGPLQWPGPPSIRPVRALHETVIPGASESFVL